MAEETEKNIIKKKDYENSVVIVGYLKENTLECVSYNGQEAIKGNLIIATSENESFKVQFFAYRKSKKSGADNKTYLDLVELLPGKTISVASYLSGNPGATFQTAAQCSTKIRIWGKLEEDTIKLDNKESTRYVIRGRSAKLRTATEARPFTPEATFTVDMYIESMKEESVFNKETQDNELTGRLCVVGLTPDYQGVMNRITYVVPKGKLADFVSNNYEVGDTANFAGVLVETFERKLVDAVDNDPFAFDAGGKSQYETKFTSERVIQGRNRGKLPIHQGEEGCITIDEVKHGLVLRDEHIADRTARRGNGGGRAISSRNAARNMAAQQEVLTQPAQQDVFSDFDINF